MEKLEHLSQGNKKRLGLLALAAVLVLIYLLVPSVRQWLNSILHMLATGNFDRVQEFVDSYGPWAMAVSFFLMIVTSVFAPLPGFLVTLTNANLFGWWQGALLSWSSAMVGAAINFAIARIVGRDVVIRFTTRRGLESIERFFARYGKQTILVARLLPFISFDIVSYAAGLTSMSFWSFFWATGVGQTPATIVYSYFGGMLTGGAKKLFIGLVVLFALSIVVGLVGKIWRDRQKQKAKVD